ncbi:MAG TPA: ABC transporter ATP-binding protein, partial [Rhodoblastus sp.]|nr:ABC transporter ATP-binding protein [Rhodoblastus sp.]
QRFAHYTAGSFADAIVALGMSHVPEGREVFPFLSVRDNLRMGAYLRKDKSGVAADLEKVYDYFPVLRERRDQPAGLLSGGQQQMLAISRALMSRPKVLLLDEPSLGLSPLLVKEIFEIVRRLNKEEGVSILLVEQNAKVALETADYGYVLEVGRVVMHDTSEALMNSNEIRESYLGVHAEDSRGRNRRERARATS